MIRITTIFLCILLGASAAGRYRAEHSVREARVELDQLEIIKQEELRSIQMLRVEVAYLENPERLAKLAVAKTDLRPSDREQILDEREFAVAMGLETEELPPEYSAPSETIANAIAMAQVADAD
ncbi:MAG: hypothetical protein HKN14_02905 [Marinicaulis sp.]|nr:hypothetical protein [Marinicaulis sp.]NNE39850.1 hypothetical protein [Marinicaulis sp.]NNL88314.1 hypothetical protein [Marinicaulis sp.]